jgi:DNA mismatch repair protein MutS
VVDGGTDKSYGVQVAALAGIPDEVVKRARSMLARLEKENAIDLGNGSESYEQVQTSLEALTLDDPIVERLRHMDLERTTPLDALVKLKELEDEARSRDD